MGILEMDFERIFDVTFFVGVHTRHLLNQIQVGLSILPSQEAGLLMGDDTETGSSASSES